MKRAFLFVTIILFCNLCMFLISCKDNDNDVNEEYTQLLLAKDMKQKSFLDELNKNAKSLGADYSLWKFGKDGFPTLEWIEEL